MKNLLSGQTYEGNMVGYPPIREKAQRNKLNGAWIRVEENGRGERL